MKDTVISVRMPKTLVKELRTLVETNHYLDLSEQIREVIRIKCLQYTKPYQYELRKMREDLEQSITASKEAKEKEKLVLELQKIIQELKK